MNNNEKNDPSQSDESTTPDNVGGKFPADSMPSTSAAGASTVGDYSAGSPQFKDRKTGLVIFGILQIGMGFCCAMLIPLMLLPLFVKPAASSPVSMQMLIPILVMYSLLAVLFVWLGAGSILVRRWARALTLVLASMWLVIGSMALLMMLFWGPVPLDMGAQNKQIPPQVVIMIQAVMLGMMGFIYIILPGTFVLFYRSQHVKATCDFHDPHVRWTDKCPLPVLALSLMLGSGAFSMIFTVSYNFVMPFFGIILKGVPGGLLILTVTLLFAYLARATYQLKLAAWWTTLVSYVTFGVSSIITFSRIDMMQFYREMNFPEEQLKLLEKSGMINRMNMPLMFCLSFVVIVGYMLWVRRYFITDSAPNVDS